MSRAESACLLVSCVLAAGLGYWAGARALPEPGARAVPVAAKGSYPRANATSEGATGRTPDAPASLSARYADLVRNADDGDREAARTLAEDLGRCMRLPDREGTIIMHDSIIARYPATDRPRAGNGETLRERTEKLRQDVESDRRLCAGVTRAQIRGRAQWLYKAALAGDAKSAFEYGSGSFIHDDLLGQLEQIPFWRDHAEEMLQRALSGGNADALAALAHGYDPARDPNDVELHFAADPVAAYAYYTALSLMRKDWMRAIAEEPLARLDAGLSDAERAEALAKAAAICTSLPDDCDL
jgi:hypothetical protein